MASKRKKKGEDVDDLTAVLDGINSEFGAGALISMDAEAEPAVYDVVSTGSLNLDDALGVGGFPRGRIVEIYGPESSGKTTVALQTIANAHHSGERCAFIDAEHALDINYAKALGVDLSMLLVSQPAHGEQALEIADRLVRSGKVAVIVIDSVAALTPKAELEGEIGDSHVGLQARLMGQALRKLVGAAAVTNTLVIFINQTRSKIGGYGNPETTPGGNALKFFASQRVKIVRTGSTKQGTTAVANTTKAKVVKNKCAPPFREAEFEITYGRGVEIETEVLDWAIAKKLIVASGAWYSLADGTRIGQGKENAKQWLRDNPDQTQELLGALRT